MKQLLFAFLKTIKGIIIRVLEAFADIPDYLYRIFVRDPWSSVGSILIYEVVSYVLTNHSARIIIDWAEKGYFKNLNTKYLLLFPISETKIRYFTKKAGIKEKTYSVVHCEDIAVNRSIALLSRYTEAFNEIIDNTIPVFYFFFFYSIFTILFQVVFTFYFDFVPIDLRNFSFVITSYLISALPICLIILATYYMRIRKVMPRKSAVKFVVQMSLAYIIIFPAYVFLYAVYFAYSFVAFLNKFIALVKSAILRVKYAKNQKAYYTLLLNIQENANGLFKDMDPMDIFYVIFIVNIDIRQIYSNYVYNICSTPKEYLDEILDKLQVKKSGASINRDTIIYSLQHMWRYGIVLLAFKLYMTAISNLERQLNVDNDGYIDPNRAKNKPMETFAFATLQNRPNYIFLFVMTLPVLILVRNLLSILPFLGRGRFQVLPAEFYVMEEVYESLKKKYKLKSKKYDCDIAKGCLMFSHVYLPDWGFGKS